MEFNDKDIRAMRDRCEEIVKKEQSGFVRVWAYRNQFLLDNGFYSSDELINLATSVKFSLADPFQRIRRGTVIEKDVVITEGSSITGKNVTISQGVLLDRADISGDDVFIGRNNIVQGSLEISRLTTGSDNVINNLLGENNGYVLLGSRNQINQVRITNENTSTVVIGNHNALWPGLNINNPFSKGSISIGHHNSLGRDGGGVISSSYRFGRKWAGDVFIGTGVESTRGAEILGFSVLGWPSDVLSSVWQLNETAIIELISSADLHDLTHRFVTLGQFDLSEIEERYDPRKSVSLFGTVKIKRSILSEKVTAKDDTRTLCSYIRNALIQERCKIYYSAIAPIDIELLSISQQDCALDHITVTDNQDWESFPKTLKTDAYPASDAVFYQDSSWDKELGM